MTDTQPIPVCREDELEVGGRRHFDIEGVPVCLVRLHDSFRAIFNVCSHEDFPLSAGEVSLDDCLIECWKHGSMFSLETGAPESFPATQPVKVFPVVVENGVVSVVLS